MRSAPHGAVMNMSHALKRGWMLYFLRSSFLILSLVLSASFASATAQDTKSCASCVAMEELRRQFDDTNYMDPQARAWTQKELVPKALAITDKLIFAKPAPPVSATEMKALVQLVASETPYDVESAGAADLAILIKRHKMESVYVAELSRVAEKCRRETLAYYAGSRLCSGDACQKLKAPKNFDDCLLEKK